jgi:hypothetical protein
LRKVGQRSCRQLKRQTQADGREVIDETLLHLTSILGIVGNV